MFWFFQVQVSLKAVIYTKRLVGRISEYEDTELYHLIRQYMKYYISFEKLNRSNHRSSNIARFEFPNNRT